MALFVEVRNVSGGPRSVVADGERIEVPTGGVIKVSPETSGAGPRWRRVGKDDDTVLMHTREHGGHLELFDLGSGLLAQPTNWRDARAGTDHEDADPLAPGHPVAAETKTEEQG